MFTGLKSNELDISEVDFTNIIDYQAFLRNTNLDSFKVNYNQIKPKNAKSMFSNANINNIEINKINFNNTVNTSYLFNNSKWNNILDLSNSDFSNVKSAEDMFANLDLSKIKFPTTMMKNASNINNMFKDTTGVEELDIGFINFNVYFDRISNDPSYKWTVIGDNEVFKNSTVKTLKINANESALNGLVWSSNFFEESNIKTIKIYNISDKDFNDIKNATNPEKFNFTKKGIDLIKGI